MTLQYINTPDAPAAIGPYSQAIIHNGVMFASGQIPLDPKTGEIVGNTIRRTDRAGYEKHRCDLKSSKCRVH